MIGLALESVIFILTIAASVALPVFFTVKNIVVLFFKRVKPRWWCDIGVFALGLPLTLISMPNKPWDEALIESEETYHSPIYFEPIIIIVMVIAVVSYWLLRVKKQTLAPMPKTIALAGLYVGCIYAVLWIVQLSENIIVKEESYTSGGLYASGVGFNPAVLAIMLFAINYLLMSARMVIGYLKEPPVAWPRYKSGFLNLLVRILSRCGRLPIAALILLLPICVVLIGILTIFGQPQLLISAFTETSDWYFSTKISPPMIDYEGHYLCTVAAQGDPRIVKPLRRGVRHGVPIVVNRQLCVANAFEDLIAEHSPRLHRFVRRNYDRYGYPICRHINTPWKADMIYIAMKPLEWLFMATLYTFDTDPERRIGRQYQANGNNK